LAEHIVEVEVVQPMLRKFAGGPSGLAEQPELLTEDDMSHIDFTCHPSEPLNILDDWRPGAWR